MDDHLLMAVADKGRVQGWAGLLSALGLILLLVLVRKGWLKASYSLVWFAGWFVCTLCVACPGVMDALGSALGIGYSPTLLVLLLIFALSMVTLHLAMAVTRLSRQVARLAQELALRPGRGDPPCGD